MSKEDPCALDDLVMASRFKEIVKEYDIRVIVETGVNYGLSTIVLADMVPLVCAIDNNLDSTGYALLNLFTRKKHNVAFVTNFSPRALSNLMPHLPDNTLYFLDAHWQQYWPLLDEIDAIRPGSGIIVLHDIQVPDHPELGYDTYGDTVLNYEYVKDALTKWSPTHRIEYNERAEFTEEIPNMPFRARGVAYIFPA